MPTQGIKGGQFKVLSEEEIYQVHLATLQVLEEVGVKVEHRPALELSLIHI